MEWWEVRDAFTGQNGRPQRDSPREGMLLACQCPAREASWLLTVFPGPVAPLMREVQPVMLNAAEDEDAEDWQIVVALELAGAVEGGNRAALQRAAELGSGRAMALLAAWAPDNESRREWAERAAERGDARGLFELAVMLGEEKGKEDRVAMELEKAAKLGWVQAQMRLAKIAETRRERLEWYCRIVPYARDFSVPLLMGVLEEELADPEDEGRLVLMAGEKIHKCVEVKRRGIAGERAVQLYVKRQADVTEECVAWVMCAKRMRVNKDVRRIISKKVWQHKRRF